MDSGDIDSYTLSIMELRHLRYFVCVAEQLHFGRAAGQLGISQPPLSQQIRLLEQELGVALFERSSRRVRLTEAGTLFLDEARATLAQADRAIGAARRAQQGELGRVAIGLLPSALFAAPVSAALARFRRDHPDVHLDVGEVSLAAQRAGLSAGTLDIGLAHSHRAPRLGDAFTATRLAESAMIVALPEDHALAGETGPLALAALRDLPMVHYPYDGEGFLADLRALFERAGVEPRMGQEARELSTLLGLVAAGLGFSILPAPLRRLALDTVCYRPLADAGASTSLWLLHPFRPRPAAARLLALLQAG
ncbi:LysR substrate-binding domain-containing protein [Sphingomonas morindae]|uniref:LysR family transcriptional regulator n=1 Tax=Sphingomonas morindae TaxID=1541170 RepID=A0ABY4X8E1_9SPHN|nr:LysR substrate-binding domain-containing protein [Sphingomonas morindae]USI73144.1 LysR family transcriptional regulator [Sphingomonas morindae]